MRRARAAILLLVILSLGILSSCTEEPPEILSEEHRVVFTYDRTTGNVTADLQLHLEVADREAAESIEYLRLTPEIGDYFWEIDGESLSIDEIDTRVWIGSNSISIPLPLTFPSGTLTGEAVTVRGEIAELSLLIPREDLFSTLLNNPRNRFPRISKVQAELRIISGGAEFVTFTGFDEKGNYVDGVKTDEKVIKAGSDLANLLKSFHHYSLTAIDAASGAVLVTENWNLPL